MRCQAGIDKFLKTEAPEAQITLRLKSKLGNTDFNALTLEPSGKSAMRFKSASTEPLPQRS